MGLFVQGVVGGGTGIGSGGFEGRKWDVWELGFELDGVLRVGFLCWVVHRYLRRSLQAVGFQRNWLVGIEFASR